jgi:predicted DNA-binding transcriptional regulator AlpA
MNQEQTQVSEPAEWGFMRVSEIARTLGISVSTWWSWERNPEMPTPEKIKLSRTVTVWRRGEVRAFTNWLAQKGAKKCAL